MFLSGSRTLYPRVWQKPIKVFDFFVPQSCVRVVRQSSTEHMNCTTVVVDYFRSFLELRSNFCVRIFKFEFFYSIIYVSYFVSRRALCMFSNITDEVWHIYL
jgi:hypothetical protein